MNLEVYRDRETLAGAAARLFVEEARKRVRASGRAAVVLAGGSTPRRAYELLAAEHHDALDWGRLDFFFGDERPVPPEHEDSNYRMAHDALLSRVPFGSVHRMRGELDPAEAAVAYEEELAAFFDLGPGEPPRFDLILLGIGGDGHTASLFPRTRALDVTDRRVIENPVEKLDATRITLTVPTINAAREVVFLVAGEDKARALKKILEGDADPRDYPARLVRPEGGANWMVDRESASLLS